MKFSEIVVVEAIRPDLKAASAEEVIRELVQSLALAGQIPDGDQQGVIDSILTREQLGSTGIGCGVAVPHVRIEGFDRFVATVGISQAGVDYGALDGEKVNLFFLLVSPDNQSEGHLRMLEGISRLLRNDDYRQLLLQTKTSQGVKQLLLDAGF